MSKPWSHEFPVDCAEDMDDAAVNILLRTMRAGRSTPARSTNKRRTNAYADAAPLHGTCGMKHYAVDECDPTARVARRCLFESCGKKRFSTKRAYEGHLRNWHGVLAADLVGYFSAP